MNFFILNGLIGKKQMNILSKKAMEIQVKDEAFSVVSKKVMTLQSTDEEGKFAQKDDPVVSALVDQTLKRLCVFWQDKESRGKEGQSCETAGVQ